MPNRSPYDFAPERHEARLTALIRDLEGRGELDAGDYQRIVRRHPKRGAGLFSKSEIIRGFRHLKAKHGWRRDEGDLVRAIRMKPVRTASGVAPVTVLTRPHPCPGRCIFCPSDVRMPKSYLSDEPGAQRAAQHHFDPYHQTLSRLWTYRNTGHPTDKVELIVLGGTWSHYPPAYQIWFVRRCFDALNDFAPRPGDTPPGAAPAPALDFSRLAERVDGRAPGNGYNRIVGGLAALADPAAESSDWEELAAAHRRNESAGARCVGLVLETRPDDLSDAEVERLRRLGATKVQIGYQSLDDEVLSLNRRGHDVAATRRAMRRLRGAGFKIHAHWMPNLYGSSPTGDRADFARIFADPGFRPDELKIYPCSLIESAELMAYWEDGRWRPYDEGELLDVLTACLATTPPYCRLTRVVRDIPGTDIVAGNRKTNFREIAERELARRGGTCRDIRAREVRHRQVAAECLALEEIAYATAVGEERFLQFVTPEGNLAAFLRLSLPTEPVAIAEIRRSAMIREVHVYGHLMPIGDRRPGGSQHRGLGAALIERAAHLARGAGFGDLAVVSAVGTRGYYRARGFRDGPLYQHRALH